MYHCSGGQYADNRTQTCVGTCPVEWALFGGAVLPAMILAEPEVKGSVYIFQRSTAKGRQELGTYCFKEPLDLPLALVMWLTT